MGKLHQLWCLWLTLEPEASSGLFYIVPLGQALVALCLPIANLSYPEKGTWFYEWPLQLRASPGKELSWNLCCQDA